MDFDIQIDNPQKIYFPGSEISGKVVLNAKTNITAGEIRVTFSGRCKGNICSHVLGLSMEECVRGTVLLFGYERLLFTGKQKFPAANRVEWPFSFVFPYMATHQDAITQKWQKRRYWAYDFGHSLPPTFATSFVVRGCGASVEYRLEAELFKPLSTFTVLPCKFYTVKSLQLMNARECEVVHPVVIEKGSELKVRDLRLSPDYQHRPLSIKDKMRNMVGNSSIPVATFNIITTMPSQVMYGAEIPMSFRAEYLPKESTAKIVPPIYLRGVTVKLEAKTGIQATTTNCVTAKQFSTETTTISRSEKLNILLDNTELDLTNVLTVACHGKNICPDFSSYSIKREYDLHVKFVLQSADRKFDVRRSITNFRVMSRIYRTREITGLPPYSLNPGPLTNEDGGTDVPGGPDAAPDTDPPEYQL